MKVLAAATLAALACAAAAQAGGGSAYVTASTYAQGKPVALTFNLKYPMRCGEPGEKMTVLMPAGMKVPAKIAPRAVSVNGLPASSVSTHGSTVSITLSEGQWITCNVVGMGDLSVVLGKKAGLANPSKPGVYGFQLAIGSVRGTPQLKIS